MGKEKLQGPCGGSLGGVLALDLIPVDAIDFFISPGLNTFIKDGLSIEPGHTYYQVVSVPDGIEASAVLKPSEHGPYYEVSIAISMGKHDLELIQWSHRNRRREFVSVLKDGNGLAKLYGTPSHPLTLTFENTTGRQTSDRNDWLLRLSGRQLDAVSVFQESTWLVAGPDPEQFFITDQNDQFVA